MDVQPPHLDIRRMEEESPHAGIEVGICVRQLLGRGGDIPAVSGKVVVRRREEAVAGDGLAVVTSRHDDLVDAETAPEFDGVARDELGEAERVELGGGDDAAVAAGCAAFDLWGDAEIGAREGLREGGTGHGVSCEMGSWEMMGG